MDSVEFDGVPKGGIREVGGYDVTRQGRRSLCVWPIGAAKQHNLEIVLPCMPEKVYLVLVPCGDEEEYPVFACYSEAKALEMAAMHDPGGRVRSISVFDSRHVDEGLVAIGPVPKPVSQAKRARERRTVLAQSRRRQGKAQGE